MNAYTEAQSAVSALEKEASDLEKQIAGQREATAAEATSSDAAAQTLNDQLTAKQAELAAKQTELEANEQAVWANVQEKLDEVTAGIEAGTPIDEADREVFRRSRLQAGRHPRARLSGVRDLHDVGFRVPAGIGGAGKRGRVFRAVPQLHGRAHCEV